jgi:hypothetical protein
VIVVAKSDRLFCPDADTPTVVDFDRIGIELFAIAAGFDVTYGPALTRNLRPLQGASAASPTFRPNP